MDQSSSHENRIIHEQDIIMEKRSEENSNVQTQGNKNEKKYTEQVIK